MANRRVDPEAKRAIQTLLVLGYSPTAVLRRVEADEALHGRVPSLRTITSMAAELRPRGEEGDTWTVGESDPDEAALVLPVLAELIAAGQMTSVTRETGRWIATIRRVVPDLPTLEVLVFAARYQAAATRGDSTHAIDVDLARRLAAKRPPG